MKTLVKECTPDAYIPDMETVIRLSSLPSLYAPFKRDRQTLKRIVGWSQLA